LENIPNELKANILIRKGVVLKQQGKYEQALADYNNALELENIPNELKANILIRKGVVLKQQREYEQALAAYNTENSPKN